MPHALDASEVADRPSSPERALLVAIIAQAVQDLTSPIHSVRIDAQRFWRAGGDIAEHRRELLMLLDLEEERVLQRIAHLIGHEEPEHERPADLPDVAPEAPAPAENATTARAIADRIIAGIPDGEFTIHGVAEALGVRPVAVSHVLRSLQQADYVRRIGKRKGGPMYFAKTAWLIKVA